MNGIDRPQGGAIDVRVGPSGRIVIPAEIRKALRIDEGDHLSARIENGALVLERPDVILERFQDYVRSRVPKDVSLVDDLIAERRAAARREIE